MSAIACAAPSRERNTTAGENAEVAERVDLALCARKRESCLAVRGVSATGDSATLEAGSVFGRSPLRWLMVGRGRAGKRSRVLVLFDVSGSMRGEGMASVRPAVNSFLASLPQERTEVAVAPFESHDVAKRIRSSAFGTPSSAARSLEALPNAGGNTGLYSAVREGVHRLAGAGPGLPLHLVVITDGVNDVRSGDDPGLLIGPSGLQAAVGAATESAVQIWTIGVGSAPDHGELAALAGSDNHAQIVATDPLALSRALRRIAALIGADSRLLVGLSARPALALGASPRQLRVVMRDEGVAKEVVGVWSPPLLAPPIAVYSYEEPKGRPIDSSWWRWTLFFLPAGVVLLAAVPVILSLETGTPSTSLPTGVPVNHGGLRPGVRETRPRSPDEITASRAERIVRMPGAG